MNAVGRLRSEYALEPTAEYSVQTPDGHPSVERWQSLAHLNRLRPALVLLAGETLKLPALNPRRDARLRLEFSAALPSISDDGLTIEVHAAGDKPDPRVLFRADLRKDEASSPARVVELSLPASEGALRLSIGCLPGPLGDPRADWLALFEVTIGPAADLDLIAARTFRQLRQEYERAHFAAAYRLPMYEARKKRIDRGIDALIPSERSFGISGAVENAFDYALARLCTRLAHKAPDFEERLRSRLPPGRPLRVLSIATGLGLTEASLLRRIEAPVELTMVDVNPELLDFAESLMPGHVRVQRMAADANELRLAESYDLAICVSGVHHLVEHRAFFRSIRSALLPDGELWLIGEQIGPSGNRLDEDALAAAQHAFAGLAPEFRRNSITGCVDSLLSNRDCSEAMFEGILSHRIEEELSRFFRPVHVSRRNCFLWRLVGPEYASNYRLDDPDHVTVLDALVDLEIGFYLAGGRPTELHGIYAPMR